MTRSCLFSLLAVIQLSPHATAQPRAERGPVIFAGREETRVSAACRRAVLLHLNGPATNGEVDQACKCVDRAFATAESSIPASFQENFIWTRPDGDVLNPVAISYISSGDLVPGPVKIAAGKLGWEVRSCIGTLPMRAQMAGIFAEDWRDQPDKNIDYLGPIVAPSPGPASPTNTDLGGLLFVRLQYVWHVVREITMYRDDSPAQAKITNRNNAYKVLAEVNKNAVSIPVLSCSYRAEAKNGYNRWMSTRACFFWYKPAWTPEVAVLAGSVPAGHPVRTIGAARDTCPIKEPAI